MSSFTYENVYINSFFSIAGPKEKKGKIKEFDTTIEDYYYGEKTFEQAEIKMQRTVIDNLLYKNKLLDSNIDLLIGGDLINQICITNTTASNYHIPYLGVYAACSTFTETLLVASNFVEHSKLNNVLCITSSHNLTAERQFRYPVEYGANKKLYSSYTATGSVGVLITNQKGNIKIESSTIGKSVDYGITDANNVGAIMAPAAAETLFTHLQELSRPISYYDLVLTGDLGEYGSILFKEVCKRKYKINVKNHMDAACMLYKDEQDVFAGGSGPVCLPLVTFNKLVKEKKHKKILLLATGSLHAKVMVDQKNTLNAISHAISLEVS